MLQLDVLTVDVKIYLVGSNQSYSPVVFGNIRSRCIDIYKHYVFGVNPELYKMSIHAAKPTQCKS